MKKKTGYVIFLLLIVVHFLMLHFFGIASFTNTLLLYALFYLLVKGISSFFKNMHYRELLIRNSQVFLLLMLVFEFSLTFVFKINNNYFENERGIYLSEYKHNAQINLLHFLGRKDAKIAWESGYKPFSQRQHSSQDFNYNIKMNQLGLRGMLPPAEKDSDEYRITVLGDSFIEGFGADHDALTFSEQLRKYLSLKGRKISVINAGICGSNPFYEINLYNNKLRSYDNDLVMMQINLTDMLDIEYAYHQDKMPVSEYFNASSHISRILYADILGYNFIMKESNRYIERRRKEILELLVKQLKDFEQQLAKEQRQFMIIYLPLNKEINDTNNTDVLINALQKSGLPLIDLKAAYTRKTISDTKEIEEYYWKSDKHHNARGYELMASIVAEQLNEMKIIRSSEK